MSEINKQETLEEAANSYFNKNISAPYHFDITQNNVEDAFLKGAKWQSDQNQEDINKLISIIEWYDNESDVRPDVEIFMWFEQFKKK